MNDDDLNTESPDKYMGYMPSELSAFEKQILSAWGNEGMPNIESIQEIAGDILDLAIFELDEVLHPHMSVPDGEKLKERLYALIDKIPRENSALDLVYRIREFVEKEVRHREPVL